MKRAVLIAPLIVGLAACAPAGNDQGNGSKKEITFLTFETPNLTPQYWDAAIKRVTDRYPDIKVKKLVAPDAGSRDAYAKQLLASGQFPDVLQAVSPQGFAESGKLAPWTDSELKNYQFPHANPIKGKIYQLPYNTQPTPLVYYNKSLFKEAGITSPPQTYKELLGDAAELQAKGITPFTVGGGGKDTFAAAYLWIALVGTDVYPKQPDFLVRRRAGQVRFADPLFKEATGKFVDLVKKGYVDKSGLSRDYPSTEAAFLSGKGAMYPMGSWFAAAADSKAHKFDIGVFPFPTDDGKMIVPAYTGGGPIVNANSKHLAEAKKFALAFNQDAANNDALVKGDGAIITIKGYNPPKAGPVYQATLDVYNQAVRDKGVVNAFTVETGDDALLTGVPDQVFALAQDIIGGGKDAGAVTAELDKDWKKAGGK
ncbi:extracellular solute-binding protein [Actinoallomurus sp. NPDC050550]|uniref:ABC transporter substrate-binding protein n=1 Tax=Actinoallomurus sp. NPDC050550 TaxID=3154937 RepID=UPI0033EAC7B7